MTLNEWAIRHGISWDAVLELREDVLGERRPAAPDVRSEAHVQSQVRLAAAAKGWGLWRNNCGALKDARGVPVRYGLCNDSAALNKRYKSGDLIGIEPVHVTPAHVGQTIGRFVSLECKEASWAYSGTPHETAQASWALLVGSLGGRAQFITSPEQLV